MYADFFLFFFFVEWMNYAVGTNFSSYLDTQDKANLVIYSANT